MRQETEQDFHVLFDRLYAAWKGDDEGARTAVSSALTDATGGPRERSKRRFRKGIGCQRVREAWGWLVDQRSESLEKKQYTKSVEWPLSRNLEAKALSMCLAPHRIHAHNIGAFRPVLHCPRNSPLGYHPSHPYRFLLS